MKILLIHHNSNNLGDVAIVEATIAQVQKQFPGCDITLESNNSDLSRKTFRDIKVVSRLFGISGVVHTKKIVSLDFFIKNLPFILRTIRSIIASQIFVTLRLKSFFLPILKEIYEADIILSVAGDSISPDYAYFLRFYEISLIHRLKKPLILYAQSIGPFEGKMLKQAKKYLSLTTAVFARDETTYKFMDEYRINTKIYRTADTVISLEPQENENTRNVIKEFGISDNTVCVVIRVLQYTNYSVEEYDKYTQSMHDIILEIIEKGLSPLIVASIPEDAEAGKLFIEKYKLNLKVLKLYDFLPSEVKTILRNIKLLISPRMHPVILSSTVGVPVIGQGREFKMRNYMRLIGQEEYFINMIPIDTEKLLSLITSILDNYSDVKADINNNLILATELSNKNGEYLKQVYNNLN